MFIIIDKFQSFFDRKTKLQFSFNQHEETCILGITAIYPLSLKKHTFYLLHSRDPIFGHWHNQC